MKMEINTPNFMGNGLRIGGAIILVIGASLAIPKIADAALTLNHILPQHSIPGSQNTHGGSQVSSENSSNEYEPPNFGRPQSAYGSGTR